MKNLINDTYFGYTNDGGLKNSRIENTLDKMINYDKYGVLKRKQFVFLVIQDGYVPTLKENYTYYSKRLDDYTKPRTLYKLENKDNFYEITKTEFEYANYLIKNNFTDIEITKEFIQNEKRIKKQQIELQKRKEEERRRELEKQKQIEEEERIKRMEARHKKVKREANLFIERLGYNPINKLLDELVPKYIELDETENNRIVPEEDKKAFYNSLYDRLILVLGDIEYTKHQLKYYRDSEVKYEFRNYILYTEQQLLLSVYGDILKEKDIHINTFYAKIDAIFYGKEFKGAKPKQKYIFYFSKIGDDGKQYFEKAEGKKYNMNNFTCYLQATDKGTYNIIEEDSGAIVKGGYTNKSDVIKDARKTIVEYGEDKFTKLIERIVNTNGGTPLYKQKIKM